MPSPTVTTSRRFATATNAGVALGLGLFLIEALCRADLSKHKTLIGVQLGISLAVIICLAVGKSFYRDKDQTLPPTTAKSFDLNATKSGGSTNISGKWIERHVSGNWIERHVHFWQRSANYFGMASRSEFVIAAGLFLCLVAITLVNLVHRKFDSDEPQHLHIIWEWTRSFIQYRDNFDNHMPLFQIAFASIVGLIGERATIIQSMRFVLFPMYFVAVWATYRIGTVLFSRRAGVWAVIGVGFFSGYYPNIGDFRPNNLWSPLWLLCIAVLIGGAMTVRRALIAGLLLGLCFGLSMKSTVFLFSLLVSAVLILAITPQKLRDACSAEASRRRVHIVQCAAAFLVTTAVVPLIIMLFFALHGLWPEFRYGVFDFNMLATRVYGPWLVYKSHTVLAVVIVVAVVPIVLCAAKWIITGNPVVETGNSALGTASVAHTGNPAFGVAFLLLVCSVYYLALQIFWTPISRTYPPIYPLIFVLCIGGLLNLEGWLTLPADRSASAVGEAGSFPSQTAGRLPAILRLVTLPGLVALVEFALVLGFHPFLKNGTKKETELLREVLTLTKPDDYVLDAKCETIFRRRSFRPVLERITIKALQRGLIVDDAPQRCIATRTCVVSAQIIRRLSTNSQQFLEQNYLPVTNNLYVAGMILKRPNGPPKAEFNLAIPATYAIVSNDGQVSGTLDGTNYDRPRFLDAGPHSFESPSSSQTVALIWAQAAKYGFTPLASK